MLDMKLVRSHPELVKAGIRKREMDLDDVVDEILDIRCPPPPAGRTGGRDEGRAECQPPKKFPKSKKRGAMWRH